MKKPTKKVDIDKLLDREDVNTFEKAEASHKQRLSDEERIKRMKEGAGRPAVDPRLKLKSRTFYMNDEDFDMYSNIAKAHDMKITDWVKHSMQMEVQNIENNKQLIERYSEIAEANGLDVSNWINMVLTRELNKFRKEV